MSSFSEGFQEFPDDPGTCAQKLPKKNPETVAQAAAFVGIYILYIYMFVS